MNMPLSQLVYRKSLKRFFLLLAICQMPYAIWGCQKEPLYKDKRLAMGTFVEVTSPDKRAADIVFLEIKRIEDLMSKYKEDSEISRLNRQGKLRASPDTMYVLRKAKEFWLLSDGAFDITVEPLLELWGFKDRQYVLAGKDKIGETLKLVGMNKIIFNDRDNVIKFSVSGMKIDLGAIAAGYALDCAIAKLKKAGINSCLINAGGDIYCLGDKFGQPWKVAVQNPRQPEEFMDYLELKDRAVATSGDYEQYFIKGKKRYAHIFDPQTGYPVDSEVVSVTVIAPDSLTADALSTTIFVLGREKGEKLAQKFPEVKVRIVEKKDVQDFE